MNDVAIAGVAQTRHESRKDNMIYADMVFDVVTSALEDAGLTLDDIDSVVTVSNDFLDGRTISGMAVGDASGGQDKNISTVEGDGTFGAFYGLMRVLSGYGASIVVAHSKGSEGDIRYVTNGMFDPIYQRLLGIEAISASAMQAREYMQRYGVSEEQLAAVSVKNHGNARNNPYAHLPMDISIDDVMKSRPIADPLKKLDCGPVSDGAAAIIIASPEIAAKATSTPVWVKGVAHCAEDYMIGDRDLAVPVALKDAVRRAYEMAGIKKPAEELDLVELYDAFSYMEPLWLEGLGLAEAGKGMSLLEKGVSTMEGSLPVNPSGGVLSSHPVLVAGLVRIIESVLQLRGQAGERQVKNATSALAHGINGPCGQSHCVWILNKDK